MATYHEFSTEAFDNALEAAKRHNEQMSMDAKSLTADSVGGATGGAFAAGGEFLVRSECISVTVDNGQVCLNLPIVGSVCLPIPLPVPSGTAAQACLDVCTTWGIPTGVKVTISVLGQVVVQKTFGKC